MFGCSLSVCLILQLPSIGPYLSGYPFVTHSVYTCLHYQFGTSSMLNSSQRFWQNVLLKLCKTEMKSTLNIWLKLNRTWK